MKLSRKVGGDPPFCKRGFWNTSDDRCYECPEPKTKKSQPYEHDIFKKATEMGVCTRTLRKASIVTWGAGVADLCVAMAKESLPIDDATKDPPPWAKAALGVLTDKKLSLAEDKVAAIVDYFATFDHPNNPMLLQVAKVVRKNQKEIQKKVFRPEAMCKLKTALSELKKLCIDELDEAKFCLGKLPFFITITYAYTGSLGASGQYGVMLVTNLTAKETKFYRFVAVGLGSDVGSVGLSFGMQGFFDKTSAEEFEDFGIGVGFTGGVPYFGPSGGIDVSIDWPIDPVRPMDGFGPNLGVSLSLSPTPVNLGVSGSFVVEEIR